MTFLQRMIHLFFAARPAASPSGPAEIVDLGATPDDASAAVGLIVARVKEALAADRKVIIMCGEEHTTVSHVRLPELLRRGLEEAGAPAPVIAEEYPHNLLEAGLPKFFPRADYAFYQAVRGELAAMKEKDPARYHRLQLKMVAFENWVYSPVANMANSLTWLNRTADVRLVDAAFTRHKRLDMLDDETGAMALRLSRTGKPHPSNHLIDVKEPQGLYIRNQFMKEQIMDILAEEESRIVILKTGRSHVAGFPAGEMPYSQSLHALFTEAARNGAAENPFRLITVLPLEAWPPHPAFLSQKALQALDTPDTIVVRDNDPDRFNSEHISNNKAIIQKEIERLQKAGVTLPFRNALELQILQGRLQRQILEDIADITGRYPQRTPFQGYLPLPSQG